MTKPKGFDAKLESSIQLLKRTERLALLYDADNGFYLAFSGGKDSQALYHLAVLAQVKFKGHMNLTSVDPPEVIRFVKHNYPDIELHKPKDSIYNIARTKKYLLPTRVFRWCCSELKEGGGANTVCLTGVRRAESINRAKRNPVEVSRHLFSGNLEEFEKWSKDRISQKHQSINQDQFAEPKDTEVRCIGGHDKIILNCLIDWTDKDVWYFLNEVMKVPHCSLYDRGYKRIGCICCPMSNYKQKIKELKSYPHVRRSWVKVIQDIRMQGYADNMLTNNDWGGGTEEQKCNRIFDWWIMGDGYDKWYADTFLQLKFDFKE